MTSSSSDILSTTAPPSTPTTASETKPTALPSTSAAGLPMHQSASSGLNPSVKVGVGVGVAVGFSLLGALLYFAGRRLQRQPQRDLAHKGSSPGSIWYGKPELTGEDAYKEMDAAERRTAELVGDETRMEMDGTPAMNRGNPRAT